MYRETPLNKCGQLFLCNFQQMRCGDRFYTVYDGQRSSFALIFLGFKDDKWIRVLREDGETVELRSLADMGAMPYKYRGKIQGWNVSNWAVRAEK